MLWFKRLKLKTMGVTARRRAAEALSDDPTPRDLRTLAAALRDRDAEVRMHAVTGIGRLDHDDRIKPLIGALRDKSPKVVNASLRALAKQRDERLQPALIKLLQHEHPSVRGRAASMIDAFGWKPESGPDAVNYFIARGQLGKAAALGGDAVPALELVLRTGSIIQRVASVDALGRINDPRVARLLLIALKSEESPVCVAAISALVRTGAPDASDAVKPLLRHGHGPVRIAAIEAIASLSPTDATGVVTPLLKDPLWDVRAAAVQALGKLKDPSSTEALIPLLADPDSDVREGVAIVLGGLGDRRAICPLVKTLGDAGGGVRRVAAAALSRIDEDWSSSPEAQVAVEELKADLEAKDSSIRYHVANLLNNLGVRALDASAQSASPPAPPAAPSAADRRKLAVTLLLSILSDADPILRIAAIESLGHIGDHHGASALQRSIRDPDPRVASAAERVMNEMQPSLRPS
jgi:HEAT repeat protein